MPCMHAFVMHQNSVRLSFARHAVNLEFLSLASGDREAIFAFDAISARDVNRLAFDNVIGDVRGVDIAAEFRVNVATPARG